MNKSGSSTYFRFNSVKDFGKPHKGVDFLSLGTDCDGGVVVVLSDVDSNDGASSRMYGEVELTERHVRSPLPTRSRSVRLLKTSFVMRGVREARSQPTHSCRADVGGTNARSTFYEPIQVFKENVVASRAKSENSKNACGAAFFCLPVSRARPTTGSPV
jgi:hypothetical protein